MHKPFDPPLPQQSEDEMADDSSIGQVIPTPQSPAPALGWREQIDQSAPLTLLVIFSVITLTGLFFLFVSAIAAVVAVFAVSDNPSEALRQFDNETLVPVFQSRLGLALTVVPPQLALLIAPILAALLFPKGIRQTLLLTSGKWPRWAWFAAAFVAPLVGVVSSTILGNFQEESDHLRQLSDAFRYHSENGFLIPLALLIGVTPAICEELLFRGFLQPRLIRLTNPGIGIFITSLAFAIFHIDPVHAIAVFPLGLWLGYITHRSQSLYPAMLAHLVNNVLSVVLVGLEGEGTLAAPSIIPTTLVMLFGISGAVALMVRAYSTGPTSIDDTVL